MTERFKVYDLKSYGETLAGSNPAGVGCILGKVSLVCLRGRRKRKKSLEKASSDCEELRNTKKAS